MVFNEGNSRNILLDLDRDTDNDYMILKMIFKGNNLPLRSHSSRLYWFELARRPFGRIVNPSTRPYYLARYCTC
jgi:hypothetical protein